MAVWDAVAKIAGKPLFRLLAERYGAVADPHVFVYAAGGYYYPGKNLDALCTEMRSYLDRGYTVVKMKIGGASIEDDQQRIEAVLDGNRRQSATRGRCERPVRSRNRHRLRQAPARISAVLVRGGRRSARLFAAGSLGRLLSRTDGDRREPLQPSGCAEPAAIRGHAAGSGLAAVRLRIVVRLVRVSAYAVGARRLRAGRRAAVSRMAGTRCR